MSLRSGRTCQYVITRGPRKGLQCGAPAPDILVQGQYLCVTGPKHMEMIESQANRRQKKNQQDRALAKKVERDMLRIQQEETLQNVVATAINNILPNNTIDTNLLGQMILQGFLRNLGFQSAPATIARWTQTPVQPHLRADNNLPSTPQQHLTAEQWQQLTPIAPRLNNNEESSEGEDEQPNSDDEDSIDNSSDGSFSPNGLGINDDSDSEIDSDYQAAEMASLNSPARAIRLQALRFAERENERPDADCSICLELIGNSPIPELNCGHTFHIQCLEQLSRHSNRCPMCREDLRNSAMH